MNSNETKHTHDKLKRDNAAMLDALKVARDFIHSLPYEPSRSPSTKTQDSIIDAIAQAEGE